MRTDHWLGRGVIYEVFPRSFSSEGTLAGVTAGLDDIARLGATVVWLMPIHPIGALNRKGTLGSPYAVRDYRAIHPDLGDENDLKSLVERAHSLGLRVIIDWVANHTAWDCTLLNQPTWYKPDERGEVACAGHGWTDVAGLDHDHPELCSYLIESMRYWVERFDIDGFRCDVAGLVPVSFWERAREALEAVKPDIGLLAEAYQSALMSKAFDLTYDMPWYRRLKKIIRGGAAAEVLWSEHRRFEREFPTRAQRMRCIDNHDQKRAVDIFGEKGSLAAAALLFTSEGAPLIYSGQEIGDNAPSRAPALFERYPIDWEHPKHGFLETYRELIALRRELPELRAGSTHELDSGTAPAVAFLRELEERRVLVGVNLSDQTIRLRVRHPALAGGHERLAGRAQEDQYRHGGASGGEVRLGPWGWVVVKIF